MPSAFGTAIGMLRLRREDLWSSRASLSMTKIAVVMLSGGAGPPLQYHERGCPFVAVFDEWAPRMQTPPVRIIPPRATDPARISLAPRDFPQALFVTSDLVPPIELRNHGLGRYGWDEPKSLPPLSPLFHGFWYVSSLSSGFYGKFRNSMIPDIWGGGGIPQILRAQAELIVLLQSRPNFIFMRILVP